MDELLHVAQQDKPTYHEFLMGLLEREITCREKKDYERRLSAARLPQRHDLDLYDFNFAEGITQYQLKELRQLHWMEQAYNVVLMGPSGTGKTFIAAGLVYEAVKAGHKTYMMTMEDIVTCLKMKELSTSAMMTYNRIVHAGLLAIDDIMLFPVKKEEATAFFNLINTLHEKTSIIITTNKAPTEWTQMLDDEVLTSALLDRLLYRCEVVKLTGTSYRLENRKTIFKKDKNKTEPVE
jgi:insertion sequence IS21-like putative ATP-binding protein